MPQLRRPTLPSGIPPIVPDIGDARHVIMSEEPGSGPNADLLVDVGWFIGNNVQVVTEPSQGICIHKLYGQGALLIFGPGVSDEPGKRVEYIVGARFYLFNLEPIERAFTIAESKGPLSKVTLILPVLRTVEHQQVHDPYTVDLRRQLIERYGISNIIVDSYWYEPISREFPTQESMQLKTYTTCGAIEYGYGITRLKEVGVTFPPVNIQPESPAPGLLSAGPGLTIPTLQPVIQFPPPPVPPILQSSSPDLSASPPVSNSEAIVIPDLLQIIPPEDQVHPHPIQIGQARDNNVKAMVTRADLRIVNIVDEVVLFIHGSKFPSPGLYVFGIKYRLDQQPLLPSRNDLGLIIKVEVFLPSHSDTNAFGRLYSLRGEDIKVYFYEFEANVGPNRAWSCTVHWRDSRLTRSVHRVNRIPPADTQLTSLPASGQTVWLTRREGLRSQDHH